VEGIIQPLPWKRLTKLDTGLEKEGWSWSSSLGGRRGQTKVLSHGVYDLPGRRCHHPRRVEGKVRKKEPKKGKSIDTGKGDGSNARHHREISMDKNLLSAYHYG